MNRRRPKRTQYADKRPVYEKNSSRPADTMEEGVFVRRERLAIRIRGPCQRRNVGPIIEGTLYEVGGSGLQKFAGNLVCGAEAAGEMQHGV